MKKSILFIITLFLSFSCTEVKEQDKAIVFDKPLAAYKKTTDKYLSNLKSVEAIALETNTECLIGKIEKLRVSKTLIYIFDKTNNSIFTFNHKGKFKFKINSIGKGSGEYIRIMDFEVIDNRVFILDNRGRKVIKYNQQGQFETEVKIKNRSIQKIGCYENLVALHTFGINKNEYYSDNDILLYSTDLKLKNSLHSPKYRPITRSVISKNNFFTYNNNTLFCRGCDNSIYQISNEGIIPFIEFSFINIPDNIKFLSEVQKINNTPYFNGEINQISDSIYTVSFVENRKKISFFLNSKNNTLIKQSNNMINSVIFSNTMYYTNNALYAVTEVDLLKRTLAYFNKMSKKNDIQHHLKQIQNQIALKNELDNPVIIVSKF